MPQDVGYPAEQNATGYGASVGNNPGMRTTRPASAEARRKLMMLMFQGMKMLGEEGLKGEAADAAQMARARSMIMQAQAAAQGMAGPPQPSNLPQGSDYGRQQPVAGRPVDTLTGKAPGSASF